jgi:hypothetical protein
MMDLRWWHFLLETALALPMTETRYVLDLALFFHVIAGLTRNPSLHSRMHHENPAQPVRVLPGTLWIADQARNDNKGKGGKRG